MRNSDQRKLDNEKLAQLKSERAKPKSFGQQIQETSVVQAGVGMVDALGNTLLTLGNTAISPFTEERAKMVKSGGKEETTSYQGGRAFGNAFSSMLMGNLAGFLGAQALGATAKAVPSTQKGVNYLTSGKAAPEAAGRLAEAGAVSAAMSPDSSLAAAEEAVKWQALFEAIPGVGGQLMKGARYIPGKDYAADVTESLKTDMTRIEKETGDLFNEAQKAAGDNKIKDTSSIEKDIEGIIPFFDKKLKEVYGKFSEEPNYENAFNLQSGIGSRARSIKGDDIPSLQLREGMLDVRGNLIQDIKTNLFVDNPEAAKILDKAQFKYATELLPYLQDPKFDQIKEGKLGPKGAKAKEGIGGELTMKELQKLMTKQVLAKSPSGFDVVPEYHPMVGQLSKLNERMAGSKRASLLPVYWPAIVGQKYGIDMFTLATDEKIRDMLKIAEETWQKGAPKVAAATPRMEAK